VRRLAAVLAAALATAALTPAQTPRVSRAALAGFESKLDRTLSKGDVTDPYDLLGSARGVYLPGYGAVFTAELNLVFTLITPFHPEMTASDFQRLHDKKLKKLPALKQAMRQMLIDAAAALETAPPSEQIVLGVTLYYRNSELKDQLPAQIVMQAPRQALLDFKAGRTQSAQLDAVLRTQELF